MESFFELIDYKDYYEGLEADFNVIFKRVNDMNLDDFTFLKFFIILNHFFDWFIMSDVDETIKQDFFNEFNPYDITDNCPFKRYFNVLRTTGFKKNPNYYLVRHICNKGKHYKDKIDKPSPTVRKYMNMIGASALGESHIKSYKIEDGNKLYDAYQVCKELLIEIGDFLDKNNLLS